MGSIFHLKTNVQDGFMKGQAKNDVNNNVTDFFIILAIALGATVCGLTPEGS